MLLISYYVTHFSFALNIANKGLQRGMDKGLMGGGGEGDHVVVDCHKRHS